MEAIPVVVIDWPQIIEDLELAGVTQYRLERLLGIEHSTAQRWASIKTDISYGYGRSLLSIHMSVCGQDRTLQRLTEAKLKV